jgi:hypothetical protein
LALTARQLVRVSPKTALGVIDAGFGEQLHGPRIGLTPMQEFFELKHFRDLLTHRHQRVESRHRFLKNHGDLVTSNALHLSRRLLEQVLALPKHLTTELRRFQ